MTDINIYADQAEIDALNPNAGDIVLRLSDDSVLLWSGTEWITFANDAYVNRWGVTAHNGDQLDLPAAITLNATNGYTLSAWLNNVKTAGYAHIIHNGGDDYWALVGGAETYINGVGGYKNLAPSTGDVLGWKHHIISYDGSSTIKYYIDGVYQQTASKNLGNIFLQHVFDATPFYFEGGTISELAIFDTMLSDGGIAIGENAEGDILSLRNNGLPVDLNTLNLNLTAWWRMGDDPADSPTEGGGVSSITDSSGNGYDLSQPNAPSQPQFSKLDANNIHRL